MGRMTEEKSSVAGVALNTGFERRLFDAFFGCLQTFDEWIFVVGYSLTLFIGTHQVWVIFFFVLLLLMLKVSVKFRIE